MFIFFIKFLYSLKLYLKSHFSTRLLVDYSKNMVENEVYCFAGQNRNIEIEIWCKKMNRLFADMHCDTITTLYDKILQGSMETLRTNSLHIDFEKMEKAKYLLQNFAVFFDKEIWTKNLYQEAMLRIRFFQEELKKSEDLIRQVTTYDEIVQNEKENRISALLTLEGGESLEGNVDNLNRFHEKGVRMITLTWNYDNELGHCHFDTEGKGLTKIGFEVVERMETLHMIPDVSHGSDTLFWDVCKTAKKPFVASHSNARSVYNRTRNMSDEMIRALSEHGGVMGMNFFAGFTTAKAREDGMCYREDILKHMKHVVNVGGIDCLGLGSDFDGIGTDVEWKNAGGMELLLEGMKKAGFSSLECDKICRENVLRVYKECL